MLYCRKSVDTTHPIRKQNLIINNSTKKVKKGKAILETGREDP
jgi:hypothetical protein